MNIATQARYKATQKAISELIESVKKSMIALEKFDNKIVNVKLINEIKSLGIESYVSLQSTHDNRRTLVFRANKREESYKKDTDRHANYVYAEIDSTSLFLYFKECNKRLDYAATKCALKSKIEHLEQLVNKYSINENEFSSLLQKFELLHGELENIINAISSQQKTAIAEGGNFRHFKIY